MSADRENNLERLLRDVINDFDQTGCSEGVGVVSTAKINEARSFLGMDLLEDVDDGSKEEEADDHSDSDEIDREDESTP
jgi:hypothetical protein